MRHNKKINHLGRTASHRNAMLSNMAASLILHKKIVTTIAKAKALRTVVEPLITKSKDDTVHSRRTVFSVLQNKYAVTELFRNIAVKVADRPGGYTRILKTGNRLGDNADMCLIELVDFNEIMLKDKQDKKAKTTRRGRTKKTKDEVEATTETTIKKTKKETAKVADAEKPESKQLSIDDIADNEVVEETAPEVKEEKAEENNETEEEKK